ncbi:MAG: M48 family metallopeptidase [Oscillospiraceae bacterium]
MLCKPKRNQYMVVEVSKETAQKTLSPVILKIFPIFSDILKGEMPTIKYRKMKSRWGVCFPTRKSITLNTQLAAMPTAAQEYVVLHEFVHFLHPDHQKGFHAEMKKLMPDYKERQKLLKMPLE